MHWWRRLVKRIILLLVPLLGVGLITYRLLSVQAGPHLLALVPRESFCVLEMRHPVRILSRLLSSPAGRYFSGAQWPDLLKHAASSPGLEQGVSGGSTLTVCTLVDTLLRAPDHFLLDTGVFALVPPEAGQSHPGPETGTPLLLGRLRNRHAFARLVTYLDRTRHLRPVIRERIQGNVVLRYQLPGHGVLFMGRYKDVFLVSPVKAVLAQAISLARAERGVNKHSLFGESFFVQGRGQAGKDLVLSAYVNVLALERVHARPSRQFGLVPFLSLLTGKGLNRIVLVWRQDQGISEVSAAIGFQEPGVSPLVRLCSLRTPVRNPELANVPAGLTTYFWSNWFSPASWWQIFLANSGKNTQQYRQLADGIMQKYLNLSMADLTALFEYDWSVFVTGIKQSAFVPVPRFCFRLGMIEPQRLARVIGDNIAALPHRLEIVSSIKVTSLIMAGGLMEPSYSFIGRDLWLFDGYDQVKPLLEPGPDRLTDDPLFQAVVKNPDKPVNMQLYVRLQPVIRGLLELQPWLTKLLTERNRPVKPVHRVLLEGMKTVLHGLAGFDAAFVSARMRSGQLNTQIRLLEGDAKETGNRNDE